MDLLNLTWYRSQNGTIFFQNLNITRKNVVLAVIDKNEKHFLNVSGVNIVNFNIILTQVPVRPLIKLKDCSSNKSCWEILHLFSWEWSHQGIIGLIADPPSTQLSSPSSSASDPGLCEFVEVSLEMWRYMGTSRSRVQSALILLTPCISQSHIKIKIKGASIKCVRSKIANFGPPSPLVRTCTLFIDSPLPLRMFAKLSPAPSL